MSSNSLHHLFALFVYPDGENIMIKIFDQNALAAGEKPGKKGKNQLLNEIFKCSFCFNHGKGNFIK